MLPFGLSNLIQYTCNMFIMAFLEFNRQVRTSHTQYSSETRTDQIVYDCTVLECSLIVCGTYFEKH